MKIISSKRYNELLKMEEKASHLEIQNLALSDEKYFNKLSSDTWKSIFKLNVKVLEEEIANKDAKIAELENGTTKHEQQSKCSCNYSLKHGRQLLRETIQMLKITCEFDRDADAMGYLKMKISALEEDGYCVGTHGIIQAPVDPFSEDKTVTYVAHILARKREIGGNE